MFLILSLVWMGCDALIMWLNGQVALSSNSISCFDLKAFLAASGERLKKQLPFLVESLRAKGI